MHGWTRNLLLVATLLISHSAWAQVDLFTQEPTYPGSSPLPPSGRRAVLAEYPIAINIRPIAQSPRSLRVRLPDGTSHVFAGRLNPNEGFISGGVDAIPDPDLPDSALSFDWYGTSGQQSLNFSVRRGHISGTLIGTHGNASIARRGSQLVFRQYDTLPIEIDEPFYLATGGKDHVSAAAALGSGSIEPLSIPYSVIRVLVLHTPAALADVGSQDQLNALVAESFA